MDRERRRVIIWTVSVILITSAVLLFLFMNGLDSGKDDDGPEDVQVYHEMGARVRDTFTTDRITSMVDPPLSTQVFLVIDLELSNPLGRDVVLHCDMFSLRLAEGERPPSMMDQFVGRSFHRSENLSSLSNISGYLHYPIFLNETVLGLHYMDSEHNLTFSMDLRDRTFEDRLWKTPLEFDIKGCGREPNGTGRERLLFFDLQVSNPSPNATHLSCWLFDLRCENGVKLDGLHVPEPVDKRFMPGWNVTYRIYFDIPPGSPDVPQTLLQVQEGMSLDIDPALCIDLI